MTDEHPPGWMSTTLGESATRIRNGIFAARPNDDGRGTPILRISAVRDGRVRVDDVKYVQEIDRTRVDDFTVDQGDLLLTRYNGSRHLVGICGLVPAHEGPILHPDKLIRVVLPSAIDSRFVAYQLESAKTRRFLEPRIRTTAGQSGISGADVKAIPLVLPPIEEQRRIVDILEGHVSRLEAADQRLRDVAVRAVAFGRSRLDALTESFAARHVPLADLVHGVEAGRSFGSSARPAGPDEWGIIKVSAMTWGEFRSSENKLVTEVDRIDRRYEIKPNDILVSRANTTEYVGAPVLVRDTRPRLLLSDKSLRLIPRQDCLPDYIVRVLSAPRARRQMSLRATGTKDSMRNISQSVLLSIEVPWVDLDDQAELIAVASDVDLYVNRARRGAADGLVRSGLLRGALLQAAFSDRLSGAAIDTEIIEELASV